MPPYTSSLVEENVATSMDGLECILQEIAKYRKKQPETEDQVEYLENICTIMASALTFSLHNVPKFAAMPSRKGAQRGSWLTTIGYPRQGLL
jgi:phage tail tape-measure protein